MGKTAVDEWVDSLKAWNRNPGGPSGPDPSLIPSHPHHVETDAEPRRPVMLVTSEERDPATFPVCRGRGGLGWDLFEYLRFMFCLYHCDHAVMDQRATLGDSLAWPWYCVKQGGRRIDFAFPTCPTPPAPEALVEINPRAPEWAAR